MKRVLPLLFIACNLFAGVSTTPPSKINGPNGAKVDASSGNIAIASQSGGAVNVTSGDVYVPTIINFSTNPSPTLSGAGQAAMSFDGTNMKLSVNGGAYATFGAGATIPGTTHLLKGDGSGNAADSGITATGSGTLALGSNTLTASHNITLDTDGTGTRTLNIGAGGTLASGAFAAAGVTTSSPLSGTTSLSLLTNVDFALTAAQTLTLAPASNTAATGLLLTDTTAATSGNQQYSPAVRWTGQGWKTNSTAASQAVDFRAYVVPVQGTANPSAYWTLESAINGGSFGNGVNVFSSGGLDVGATTDPGAGNLYLAGASIQFALSQSATPSNGLSLNTGSYVFRYGGANVLSISSGYVGPVVPNNGIYGFASSNSSQGTLDTAIYRNAAGVVEINNGTAGTYRDLKLRNVAQTGTTTTYNNIATAGIGLPAILAAGRATAQSAANSNISQYTVGASDGSFEVSMNMNVTAATVISTSLNCDYTDESNTARTMIFPTTSLSGTFLSGGLVTATGAFETPVMHIRCKASTTITLYTATGTFSGVTYTAEGNIKQTK